MSSDLFHTVHKTVISVIQQKPFMNSELKRALLNSDNGKQRLKLLAANIVTQIKSEQNWVFIDEPRLKSLVADLTELFLALFKKHAEEKAISEAMKNSIVKENTKFDFLDSNGNGIDPETGIKIVDKEVTNGTTNS